MRNSLKIATALCTVVFLCAGEAGCDNSQVAVEAQNTNLAMRNISRNQPTPYFDFSLERRMLTQIYQARQRATQTFSVVQSEYTGRILWSCPSIGFPLPYATQLTNPHQIQWGEHGTGVVEQAEPNGLYSPSGADGTWVPCLGPDGRITPVYEEKRVSVFLQPMQEVGGRLVPIANTQPSFSISAETPHK